MANQNNLTYSIFENVGNHEEEDVVEYADLMQQLKEQEEEMSRKNSIVESSDDDNSNSEPTLDDILALQLDYDTNYTKKDLVKIAEYYEISVRKKNKKDKLLEYSHKQRHHESPGQIPSAQKTMTAIKYPQLSKRTEAHLF